MLRLPKAEAAKLAAALSARTGGNPYDTVELINALRQDGVLELGDEGWVWNDEAVRRHIGRGDVIDLLAVRISRLPPGSRELVEIMACLGGEVEMGILQAATDLSPLLLEERLTAPLEDGLLAMEQG
jgi:predicted ATPase